MFVTQNWIKMAASFHLGSALRSLAVSRNLRSLLHIRAVLSVTPVRGSGQYAGQKEIKTDPLHQSQDDFTPIYKFPYITHAYVLCRLKIYQTCITVIMVPASIALNSAGMVTVLQCQLSIAVSAIACVILYVMGSFFRRLVGIMYVNRAQDTLKISHLTFMGNRRNKLVPIQDVVPLADIGNSTPKVIYHPLRLYSSNEDYYYYILRYGGILQPNLFQLVFGEGALMKSPQKIN